MKGVLSATSGSDGGGGQVICHLLSLESMELQEGGVSKTCITHVHALKDVTPTIPAGMYGPPRPVAAGRSA